MNRMDEFWRGARLLGVAFFSVSLSSIGLGLLFSERFGATRGPAIASIGGGVGTAVAGLLLFSAGRRGFVLDPGKHLWPVTSANFLSHLLTFFLLGVDWLDPYAGALAMTVLTMGNSLTMALAMTAVLAADLTFAKVRCFGTVGFAVAFVMVSSTSLWWAVFSGLVGLAVLAWVTIPTPAFDRDLSEETRTPIRWWPLAVAIVAYSLLAAVARTYEIFGPLRLVGSQAGITAVLVLATLEIVFLLYFKSLELYWVAVAAVAWVVAYTCFAFLGEAGEMLAMAFVSLNCLAQSSLSEFARRQRHSPGNAQLAYQLSASAVGIAIAMALSTMQTLAGVWSFALGLSIAILPGLLVCALVLRKRGKLVGR